MRLLYLLSATFLQRELHGAVSKPPRSVASADFDGSAIFAGECLDSITEGVAEMQTPSEMVRSLLQFHAVQLDILCRTGHRIPELDSKCRDKTCDFLKRICQNLGSLEKRSLEKKRGCSSIDPGLLSQFQEIHEDTSSSQLVKARSLRTVNRAMGLISKEDANEEYAAAEEFIHFLVRVIGRVDGLFDRDSSAEKIKECVTESLIPTH